MKASKGSQCVALWKEELSMALGLSCTKRFDNKNTITNIEK